LILAGVGAGAGLVFPKYEATALLDTPGSSIVEIKRVMPAYASEAALRQFFAALGASESSAANRLQSQARGAAFWESAARPVLPISRKDTKEIGDMKEGPTTSLIGLELKADGRDPETAEGAVLLLGDFFANALLRERIREWIVSGLGESRTRQKSLRADTIAAQLEIDSSRRRIADLKSIVTRYPDASRFEGRQVVSVAEGGDRFLPPTAQLVAAEARVSQVQESILRNERRIRQLDLLAGFYEAADTSFRNQVLSGELIQELQARAQRAFGGSDSDAEWSRESMLRTESAISGFAVALASLRIRNGARVQPVVSRSPLRLGALGAALGLVFISALAFVRMSVRGARQERQAVDESLSEIQPSELKRVA
jgi:hypothetical protein